ncbi:MAG: hypothetical protein KDJ90_20715 [Nitratireductor sp.]|nr:hypothetical protein [Nitratireductor sp.]
MAVRTGGPAKWRVDIQTVRAHLWCGPLIVALFHETGQLGAAEEPVLQNPEFTAALHRKVEALTIIFAKIPTSQSSIAARIVVRLEELHETALVVLRVCGVAGCKHHGEDGE